ncbi:MAG: hypothetical protein P857_241 [Candidatus Xenolissoclinum pacificiensis L6]|uniref:Uncharacterized protein n=1 Tax=Candidatus Xenolissoclinum pacificiensis L6 TaxID=1401685 RepID=W2UZQ2_9RICK|nr:MAG: hypothetical protein P857_241 [Candidatus Xenolissoclinum pacificiensis L6]
MIQKVAKHFRVKSLHQNTFIYKKTSKIDMDDLDIDNALNF